MELFGMQATGDINIVTKVLDIRIMDFKRIRHLIHSLAGYRTRCLLATDETGCHEDMHFVNQPAIEQATQYLASTFHEQVGVVPFPQFA